MSLNFVVISGCSGGGKSTLLAELAARGFATVEEPGRRIVAEEMEGGGAALPWVDPEAFARRAVAMARDDRTWMAGEPGRVFFDRGLVDAAVALAACGGEDVAQTMGESRYCPTVFMTPPWPEIFRADAERRHGFDAALAEYGRLALAYPRLGYEVVEMPRMAVGERADFVLGRLAR